MWIKLPSIEKKLNEAKYDYNGRFHITTVDGALPVSIGIWRPIKVGAASKYKYGHTDKY